LVIYNGIDDQWHVQEKTNDQKDEDYWIWWGYLSPRKNLINLIKAYSLLLSQFKLKTIPKLTLILSGQKEKIKSLTEFIHFHSLQDNIVIKPQQGLSSLINAVDGSRGVVFPSYYEGFGLPIVEAMSRGKNVICSDIQSLREVSGGFGAYFDPNDPEDIAFKLFDNLTGKWKHTESEMIKWAAGFSYVVAARKYNDLINELSVEYIKA
jgi:glycosyltransferase involved in cell wall biosynthesis